MQVKNEAKEKSTVELMVELSWEEFSPYITKAAAKVSEQMDIPGFRKGQAPVDMVKQKIGEMTLLQEAAALAVEKTLPEAIKQENLETVGQPSINFEKLAEENPLVYSALLPILPEVKVGEITKVKVKREEVEVTEEELSKVIENLRAMRAKEVLVEREAKSGDKTEIGFKVFLDAVPVDGGTSEKYPLVLGEGSMIPGFEEQVEGMKAGEEKEFKLTFPEDYHNKQLAGKEADFKVTMQAVYERQLPEVDKNFAAEVGGFASVDEMKDAVEKNIFEEKKTKTENQFENKVLEELIELSVFSDIPEIMLNQETEQMMSELERNLMGQGLKLDDYLQHLKKDRGQLKLDFTPDAMKRIKTALVIRTLAKEKEIRPSLDEIHAEVEKMKQAAGGNPQMMQQVESPAYQEYLGTVLRNKKTLEWIKEQVNA